MREIDEQGKKTLGGHLVAQNMYVFVKSNQSMIECSRARERTTSRDKVDVSRGESEGKNSGVRNNGGRDRLSPPV